jgi:hypothetical protein
MSNRFSTFDNRIVYENGLKQLAAVGLTADIAKLTQSTIRLEQQLYVNKSQYQFGVLVNNNGPAGTLFPTEVRLNQQDALITSSIVMYIGEPVGAATDCTFIDHTYPNPLTFVGTGEASALETLYKSQLSITVNNVVVMPTLQTQRFRLVPSSQKVTAAANQNGIGNDQIDGSSDGLMINEPNIVLIGSKNNIINLTLPAALAVVGSYTRVIYEFRGILAQNCTIIT